MLWFLPTLVVLAVLVPMMVVLGRPRAVRPIPVRVDQRRIRDTWGAPGHK